MKKRRAIQWGIAVSLVVLILGLHTWVSVTNIRRIGEVKKNIQKLQDTELPSQKTRQELLSLQIENNLKSILFSQLITALSPLITILVALLGAWIALRNYLDTRTRERLDRAAGDLKAILESIASQDNRKKVLGLVGLQYYFTPDKKEYHLQALSALISAARMEDDAEVLRNIRIAGERAVHNLTPDVLRAVSWQGINLKGVNFSGRNLAKVDFRDANLEDADFSGCDLYGIRLTNSRLNGASLKKALLREADLSYADLAGASLESAELKGALFHHVKVLQMDLQDADLRGAKFNADEIPWEFTKNWRKARYDEGIMERLIKKYGPVKRGTRALMLMWEIPPLVAGGTWTACYHLIRNLRQKGIDVTVVVPWSESSILSSPFGCEVEVVPLGILPPQPVPSSYGWGVQAPNFFSPYSSSGYSGQGHYMYGAYSSSSPYAPEFNPGFSPFSAYGTYAGTPGLRHGSIVLRLIDEFRKRLVLLKNLGSFDIIHAHDWVTFDAAEEASRAVRRPWVAHFHSTEIDRRPSDPDIIIERIEQQGADRSAHIVAPGKKIAGYIQRRYKAPETKITIIPNTLSRESIDPECTGRFETKRVVYLGRLTGQKGTDFFESVAKQYHQIDPDTAFWIFGEGEEQRRLAESRHVVLKGPLEWKRRSRAFQGASAVLVPSRSEPFGMVVLEAMQHRVPVLYPKDSGAADVLRTGIQIAPKNIAKTVSVLQKLLSGWRYWEETVQVQAREVDEYIKKDFEQQLVGLWSELISSCPKNL